MKNCQQTRTHVEGLSFLSLAHIYSKIQIERFEISAFSIVVMKQKFLTTDFESAINIMVNLLMICRDQLEICVLRGNFFMRYLWNLDKRRLNTIVVGI